MPKRKARPKPPVKPKEEPCPPRKGDQVRYRYPGLVAEAGLGEGEWFDGEVTAANKTMVSIRFLGGDPNVYKLKLKWDKQYGYMWKVTERKIRVEPRRASGGQAEPEEDAEEEKDEVEQAEPVQKKRRRTAKKPGKPANGTQAETNKKKAKPRYPHGEKRGSAKLFKLDTYGFSEMSPERAASGHRLCRASYAEDNIEWGGTPADIRALYPGMLLVPHIKFTKQYLAGRCRASQPALTHCVMTDSCVLFLLCLLCS